jgi:hypothetical protein
VKPGELSRNLSRLAAIAARAHDRFRHLEREVRELRALIGPAVEHSDIEVANRTPGPSIAQVGGRQT